MATLVRPQDRILPTIGAIVLVLALALLFVLPVLYGAFMLAALTKLHLTPGWAAAIVLAMLFGGLVNIPVKRYRRDDLQPVVRGAIFNLGVVFPEARLAHSETVLAVNLGGCVIPTLLALYEMTFVVAGGSRPLLALAIAAAINIFICYKCATPVRGVGMAVPAFIPPIAAVLITWMLLSGNDFSSVRAPAAFIAGVAGPLVGGHLLHLGKIRELATGMASIGGAGTFDGIVFASVVAAFLLRRFQATPIRRLSQTKCATLVEATLTSNCQVEYLETTFEGLQAKYRGIRTLPARLPSLATGGRYLRLPPNSRRSRTGRSLYPLHILRSPRRTLSQALDLQLDA